MATWYHCQLVPSALRSCNWCQAIPQSPFHTEVSCNLHFTLVSAAICISCLYLLLSLWYAYYPIHTTTSVECRCFCLQQFTNLMPHSLKPTASFISFPILLWNYWCCTFCHHAVATIHYRCLYSDSKQFSSFKAVTVETHPESKCLHGCMLPTPIATTFCLNSLLVPVCTEL